MIGKLVQLECSVRSTQQGLTQQGIEGGCCRRVLPLNPPLLLTQKEAYLHFKIENSATKYMSVNMYNTLVFIKFEFFFQTSTTPILGWRGTEGVAEGCSRPVPYSPAGYRNIYFYFYVQAGFQGRVLPSRHLVLLPDHGQQMHVNLQENTASQQAASGPPYCLLPGVPTLVGSHCRRLRMHDPILEHICACLLWR